MSAEAVKRIRDRKPLRVKCLPFSRGRTRYCDMLEAVIGNAGKGIDVLMRIGVQAPYVAARETTKHPWMIVSVCPFCGEKCNPTERTPDGERRP